MPTGGGKSLCYQLPAVLSPGLTVVVSPLLALMSDQIASLRALGIPCGAINSIVPLPEIRETEAAIESGELRLLYVAPERFASERFLARLDRASVSRFVVDEAHCVSQWGHDFRQDYLALKPAIKSLGSPPVGAFTATATQEVRRDIEVQLGIEGATYFFSGFDRENLRLEVIPAPKQKDKLAAIMMALSETPGPAIVYCATRKNTEATAAALDDGRFGGVTCYHAGMEKAAREAAQDEFMSGRARVIVATCAFGMGIDKSDIRLIVHHAITDSVESYYQEIGRAGRDREPARCILLWHYPDVIIRRGLMEHEEATPEILSAKQRRLARMIKYVDNRGCRRGFIIDYFLGRHAVYECGMCDNCLGTTRIAPVEERLAPAKKPKRARPAEEETGDPTALEWARMALSCIERVRRSGFQPTTGNTEWILRGHRNEEVEANRWDTLSTWNLFTGWNQAEYARLLEAILRAGLIAKRGDELKLTDLGREVMAGRKTVELSFRRDEAQGELIVEKSEEEHDPQLFEKLRAWRLGIARAAGFPAFRVLGDATLRQIAVHKPRTLEELAAVKGIGPAKLEKYGEAILELLAAVD